MDRVLKKYVIKVEDLVAGKVDPFEAIEPVWNTVSIYDGLEQYEKDLEQFTDAQRKVFAYMWYDGEVNNGGHDQFFSNSTGIVWKDAYECMLEIGATETAANFKKAIDIMGGDVPFDTDERNAVLDKVNESDDEDYDPFGEIDSFFYEQEEVGPLLEEYIKKHAAEFAVDGEYMSFI